MTNMDIGEAMGKAKDAAAAGASKAGAQAQKGAAVAWEDILAAGKKVGDLMRVVRGYSADDLLGAIGLYRRRGILPMLGAFTAGVTVGVGAGLLFAPKSGAEMRALINDMSKKLMSNARTEISETSEKVAKVAKKFSDTTRAEPGNGGYVS
jgi:hypothetical protein